MLRVNVNKPAATKNAHVARIGDELRRDGGAVVISQPTAESLERVRYWTRGQAMREERRLRNGQTKQPDHIEHED